MKLPGNHITSHRGGDNNSHRGSNINLLKCSRSIGNSFMANLASFRDAPSIWSSQEEPNLKVAVHTVVYLNFQAVFKEELDRLEKIGVLSRCGASE